MPCYFCASLSGKYTAQTLLPGSPITTHPCEQQAELKGAGEVMTGFKMKLNKFIDADVQRVCLQHQALAVTATGLS